MGIETYCGDYGDKSRDSHPAHGSMSSSSREHVVMSTHAINRRPTNADQLPPYVGGGHYTGGSSSFVGGSLDEGLPCRVHATVSLPLATVSVREARQLSVPFAFDVIAPQSTVTLLAQSQEEMQLWMQVLQNATASSLGMAVKQPRASVMAKTVMGRVRAVDGNQRCADCEMANPQWASINLGVVFCTACAGIHRQMGVHISKVRSLELDTKEWSAPLVKLLCALGNAHLNGVWETPSEITGTWQRPTADASAAQREAFIRRKYEGGGFVSPASRPANEALFVAALTGDARLAASCLAHGFEFDGHAPSAACGAWTAEAASAHAGRTALQVAAVASSETVLELLLQNLARSSSGIDCVGGDAHGRSALHLAVQAETGNEGIVDQLITRGANISSADVEHLTPMHAAAKAGREDLAQRMLDYKLAEDEKRLAQYIE